MKAYYDLHIHSALSPCASEEMTPHNIVNMAKLKELDIIAVTDHNNASNLRVISKLAKAKNLLFIPGIEVESQEGVHILCYFQTVDSAESFGAKIFDSLPKIKTNKVFGEQQIFDENDEVIDCVETLLINSAKFTIDKIYDLVQAYEGIMIYAHVFRQSNGILSVLGFFPDKIPIKTIEIYASNLTENRLRQLSSTYNIITNSDAHQLQDINERENFFELDNMDITSVFNYLKTTRHIGEN